MTSAMNVKKLRDLLVDLGYNPTLKECLEFLRTLTPQNKDKILQIQIRDMEENLARLRDELKKTS